MAQISINRKITVAGVDPGLAFTGIAIVKGGGIKIDDYAFGCVKTSRTIDISSRLEIIYNRLFDFFSEHKPDLVVIEEAFSLDAYPGTAILLGNVIGVILLAARKTGTSSVRIAVREVKKSLCGNGAATKSQLERAVRSFLNHPDIIRPNHASDALAMAIAGFNRFGISISSGLNISSNEKIPVNIK